ncbi:MAG: hypothetical protein U0269_37150 [Polyangiales bacterium]
MQPVRSCAASKRCAWLVALWTASSSVGCASMSSPTSPASLDEGRSSGAQSSCPAWGSRGFSLVVRAQSSHALFFREFAYDDRSGVVRVDDSDLFAAADGHESREPRVIQRSITLDRAQRDELARDLMAMCPDPRELEPLEAAGGGTTLVVTTASGAQSRVRYATGTADVARRAHARFVRYFPELRRQ